MWCDSTFSFEGPETLWQISQSFLVSDKPATAGFPIPLLRTARAVLPGISGQVPATSLAQWSCTLEPSSMTICSLPIRTASHAEWQGVNATVISAVMRERWHPSDPFTQRNSVLDAVHGCSILTWPLPSACAYQATRMLNVCWSSQQVQLDSFLWSTQNLPGWEVIILTTGWQCNIHQTKERSSSLHQTHYLQSPQREKCNCNLFLAAPPHTTATLSAIIWHAVIRICSEISGFFCWISLDRKYFTTI